MSQAPPEPERAGRFRVGRYVVDPRRNRVTGPDGPVVLQPKVMDLLCLLADHPGEVLSRATLIDRIWGVEHGGDESLTRAVSQLRRALNDTRAEPRIVETIAKRGYRLVAPVRPAEPAQEKAVVPRTKARPGLLLGAAAAAAILLVAVAAWLIARGPAPARTERTGIVVLVDRFEADRGAPTPDGLAEELSTAIARNPLIRARLAGAATAEGEAMRYALRGQVRRVQSRIRVSAQLVDLASGDVVWGEAYDRAYDPQFAERDGIVHAIARELQLPLLRAAKQRLLAEPILSLAPWELTLLVTWVPGDEVRPTGPPSEDSYWLQRRALEIDPDFAPAHALFAQLASYHFFYHPPADTPAARRRARRHAERAIELAPFEAEVLYQVAIHYRNSGDRDRARALLERVLQLHPDHPLAPIELQLVRGQCDEGAGAAIERLQAIEAAMSRSNAARWVAFGHLSALHLSEGDFARAREAARRARTIVPVTATALPLAAADAELGLAREAMAVLAEHRREWPALDLDHFAERLVPRWCMNGSRTGEVQASFLRLAETVERGS